MHQCTEPGCTARIVCRNYITHAKYCPPHFGQFADRLLFGGGR